MSTVVKKRTSPYEGMDFPTFIARQDVQQFIGEDYEYYKTIWTKDFEKTGDVAKIWNQYHWSWLSFFSVMSWFGYRKMYGTAICLSIALAGISFLDDAFQWNLPNASFAAPLFLIGLKSKGVYFIHVVEFFNKNKDKPEAERQALIAEKGGVSVLWAVVFFIVPILLIIGALMAGDAVAGVTHD